jgi:Fe-S-cluster-containing dehydrogenase component
MEFPLPEPAAKPPKWAKVIDHTVCIGCHACSTACKSENQVPLSVNRTYVKYVDVGAFPNSRRAFQVTRCNQCEDPPCAIACPTAAMHQRADGIVDFDKSICIGCKACIAACPYDAIFINPEDHSAEKCNFCAHRLDIGLEPACVVVCPTEAILVGDMHDPDSRVAYEMQRHPTTVRRPEKETRPKLFYKGATQATLDPLAATRPEGGLYMWSEQPQVPHGVDAGHPDGANNSAAAILAYDVPHRAPWDWRVSLYTWTKGIAAGVYLAAALLVLLGVIDAGSPLWQWIAPIVGGAFLGVTGAVLIWDLEHPERFYYIFTKAQSRSWLVRGGYIIGGYSAVLGAHFLGSLMGGAAWQSWLMIAGIPLALGTAVYTAYLFAQAKARDLWQSPLLPPHMAVQALLVGSAALVPFALTISPETLPALLWVLGGSALVHLAMVLGEITMTHPTAHAHLATKVMTRGKYAGFFHVGWLFMAGAVLFAGLAVAGAGAVAFGPVAAGLALAGLLSHEHAYVQAGQAVPLA